MRGRGFGRGHNTLRSDVFRSRPPNTSRPPSMHVDDFVKMETENQHVSDSSYQPAQPNMGGQNPAQNRQEVKKHSNSCSL